MLKKETIVDERDYQIHEWFNTILINMEDVCDDQLDELHSDVKALFEKHFEIE